MVPCAWPERRSTLVLGLPFGLSEDAMRRALPTAIVAAAALVALGGTPTQAARTDALVVGLGDPDRVNGQYVVLLDRSATTGRMTSMATKEYGAQVEHVYSAAVRGFSARMTLRQARGLAGEPGVQLVQADLRIQTAAQRLPTGVNRANADASPTARINRRPRPRLDVDVAVIDSGVDLDHPDLRVHRAGATNCTPTPGGANDQNGHGTHVAGTIGAIDNRTGVVGVAPGARIWPVRVLDAFGSGTMGEVICGVDFVTANAARIEVANMSLGAQGGRDDGRCGASGDAMHRAICRSVRRGVTYVVAAGNAGVDASFTTPAAYNEVITVSALADYNGRPGGGAAASCPDSTVRDDAFADFSNFGPDVDLVAPGVCIRSTAPGGRYATMSGTSMASPHVAGAAALFLATRPNAAPARVRQALVRRGSAWSGAGDPDARREPLVDVTGF
jgi:subtilisin